MIMETIKNAAELKARIALLHFKAEEDKTAMHNSFHVIVEKMQPVNLMRSAVKQIAGAPDLKRNILGTAIGVGAGLVSKKLFLGKSPGIFKKVLGTALQLGLTKLVATKVPQFVTPGKTKAVEIE
jgi:hypothetical protein